MRQLLYLMILSLVLLPVALAADASVSFVVPAKVASDVPFAVQVQADGGTQQFIDYDLTVGIDKGSVFFGPGVNKQDPFNLVSSGELASVPSADGKMYHVRTETNGKTYGGAVVSLFTLTNVKLTADVSGSAFTFVGGAKDTITPAASGVTFTLTKKASSPVTVNPSVCGDSIVGYVDANMNGKFDIGEVKEACDTKLEGGQGCSSDCTYIDAGYKIKGMQSLVQKTVCDFASTSCGLEQLQPRERLLAKLNAIFSLPVDGSGNCFPYKGHPANDPKSKDYGTQKLKGFCVMAEGVTDQIPPLLDALKEFYSLK